MARKRVNTGRVSLMGGWRANALWPRPSRRSKPRAHIQIGYAARSRPQWTPPAP
jgi:hypothetical protein